jgi:hypothetical protein
MLAADFFHVDCAVTLQRPYCWLKTLADVFAYAAARGVTLRIDGTEVQVRRPRAGRPGRRAFVSGKKKQNTIKATAVSDGQGRLLWSRQLRPPRPDHPVADLSQERIQRRPVLGGLISEYKRAA